MLKLGLSQRVISVEAYRERRDCLDQMWTRRLIGAGYLPVPLPNLVEDVEAAVTALGLDGLILTGGNDLDEQPDATDVAPERDRFEHRLIDCAARRRMPLLGVCRGLQILVTHWGGRLTRVSGHAGCEHRINVEPEAGVPIGQRETVNSFHRYGIQAADIGEAFRVLATAVDGTIEAVAHKALPQWGIMWHPERAPSDSQDLELFRHIFQRPSS